MGEKAKQARELFEQGYNCAQSVFGAYAKECGLTQETALLLSSTFGGGMGRMREVCGAVSGMLMAAGILYGYNDPKADEEKQRTYAMVQELARRFREQNDSIICRELLGLKEQNPADSSASPTPRTPEFYQKRPCSAFVECAAELLEEYSREIKNEQG